MRKLLLLLLLPTFAFAQAPWNRLPPMPIGTATQFTDMNLSVGDYCYRVLSRNVTLDLTSVPSNEAGKTITVQGDSALLTWDAFSPADQLLVEFIFIDRMDAACAVTVMPIPQNLR